MKTFLYIIRRSPYAGVWAQEAIDSVLTTAAFDQKVRVLFLDDGVFQLLQHQAPRARKPVSALLRTLALYDVEDVLVEYESLRERGMDPEHLALSASLVSRADIPLILDAADLLMGC